MEGQILSHYRVLSRLGGGGMGLVYKAEDLRLKRPVALKFLPPGLTRDDDARERFVQEAQAASALDHANICTIYEIDTAADGQLFIAMAYISGQTLKKRLTQGPLSVHEAVDIALQIARGLEKAHHAGIVHRDIKPANVMLSDDGVVKIVDFGIAKLMDHTGLTQTGTSVGTVAYMAPEQVAGASTDQRVDLWALGVVLYEMLTGRLPFGGDQAAATLNNILTREPAPVSTLRAEVSPELQLIVERALAKTPENRYAAAAALGSDLAHWQASLSTPVTTPAASGGRSSRRAVVVAAAITAVVIGLPAAWMAKRFADARQFDAILAEAVALADRDEYAMAVARAEEAERLAPDDPRLAELWPRIAVRREIATDPPGADVSFKRYADASGPWTVVGRAPIADVRLPRGVFRWRIEKEGFDPLEFISPSAPPPGAPPAARILPRLAPKGDVPEGMVLIAGGMLPLTLTGYDFRKPIPAGSFAIDRYEVTNRQFKQFVDAGGYTRQEYWKQPLVRNGQVLPWEQARELFRDRTGRPGPSTWEVGTYPEGQDDHPVGGVSWFEAVAYAEFAGKSLPTVYHWLRGAGVPQAAYITPQSNMSSQGPARVGSFNAVSGAGLSDTAGNVKEWCWNEVAAGADRYLLGGSWIEPQHMFTFADARPPFDRSADNGFRLVKYLGEQKLAEGLTAAVAIPRRDNSKLMPVTEQVFQAIRAAYAYDATPLDAAIESSDASAPQWVKEKVSFRAAYGGERVTAYVFTPKNARPPYQAIVFAPGAASITAGSSATLQQLGNIDYVLVSGRAVIYPVYKGTYERNTGQTGPWPDSTRAYQDWMVQVVNDVRRSVDYLESRPDVRRDALAYLGSSWGSSNGTRAVALEPRFKAAVFMDGGLSPADDTPPQVDGVNFVPRITIPTLMVNGSGDNIYAVEANQKPLFTFLGTPADRKRHVILPGGHGIMGQQRSQSVKEVLDWLDRYLGPVER
jgi:formylglycine-generating enzyme required for sulfatase activity/dienelactone hydrolase/predicted Ser/Thr protein kinase